MRIGIISNLEGRFEEAVIAYLFLVNILPIFIIPLMWAETKKIASVMNDWNDFEVKFSFNKASPSYARTIISDPILSSIRTTSSAWPSCKGIGFIDCPAHFIDYFCCHNAHNNGWFSICAGKVKRMFVNELGSRLTNECFIKVVPYCLLDNLTVMLGAYWYLLCEVLSKSAFILAENFQKVRANLN